MKCASPLCDDEVDSKGDTCDADCYATWVNTYSTVRMSERSADLPIYLEMTENVPKTLQEQPWFQEGS